MIKHNAASWREKKAILEAIQKGDIEYLIPSYEITAFELTTAGFIQLRAYPDEAVTQAHERLLKMPKPSQNYSMLIKLLDGWCKTASIAVDREWVRQLNEVLHIKHDAPFVKESKRFICGRILYGNYQCELRTADETEAALLDFIQKDSTRSKEERDKVPWLEQYRTAAILNQDKKCLDTFYHPPRQPKPTDVY